MTKKTETKTLFLAWQDRVKTRGWFPIGRLDVDQPKSKYRFRYTRGAELAHEKTGFPALVDFPEMDRAYEASELFPLFKNRVLTPGRPDFLEYLKQLDLSDAADPIEILEVGGGHRATDALEVFPKLERSPDGSFRCRFFLHGARYVNPAAQERLKDLKPDDPLNVTVELNNPATGLALQLQTGDYFMIGWAPRYLIGDLVRVIVGDPGECSAHVVRLNPVPAPSKQRLLVELRGRWPNFEPMTTEEFEPLVA